MTSTEADNAFLQPGKEKAINLLATWDGLVLGDYYYISKGMVLNSDEKLKKIKFKKDDLIKNGSSDENHPLRYVDNEDLGFGRLLDRQKKFIEYGPGLRAPEKISRPTFPELHSGDRILLNRSKQGSSAVGVAEDLIVSDNTIVLKKWSDLIGVSNRSLVKKAKASRLVSDVKIPKEVSNRVLLEEASALINDKVVLGILLSEFFKSWVANDKRHKHNVVPDVISEFPIPVIPVESQLLKPVKYDLTFQTKLKSLSKLPHLKRQTEVLFHIEKVSSQIIGKSLSSGANQLKKKYLDALVELLYEPLTSKRSGEEFKFKNIIKAIVSLKLELLKGEIKVAS